MKRTWFWAMILTLILVCFIPAIPTVLKMYITTYNELIAVLGPTEWGARPALADLKALNSPILRIILSDTLDQPESCKTKDECIGRLQAMQTFYMDELQLSDIPFNFLVGDDGNVYEGRGFTYQGEIPRSDNVNFYDDAGLFVALIGDFTDEPPSAEQNATFWKFVESSVKYGMIVENFSLLSQNQIAMKNVSNGLKVILNKDVPNFHESMSKLRWHAEIGSLSVCFSRRCNRQELVGQHSIPQWHTSSHHVQQNSNIFESSWCYCAASYSTHKFGQTVH